MQWYTEVGPGREGHKTLEAGREGGMTALRFMKWYVEGSQGYPKSTRGSKAEKLVRCAWGCI